MLRILALSILSMVSLPAAALAFDRVSDRDTFLNIVAGKDLRIPLYGLTLNVRDDGTIAGRAAGWDVTGSWSWQDGYFCRDMDWSGYEIDYNCQLVEVNGDRIRFTVDQGNGDDAVLRIR